MGDRLTVSTLLTTVDEPGALEAIFYVPAERAKNLKPGFPCGCWTTPAKRESSAPFLVSPQVDTATETVLARRCWKTGNQLRIAQKVARANHWGTHEGPVIPEKMLCRSAHQWTFFAFLSVNEGQRTVGAAETVKLGERDRQQLCGVWHGVNPGDHVIVSGNTVLQDGMLSPNRRRARQGLSHAVVALNHMNRTNPLQPKARPILVSLIIFIRLRSSRKGLRAVFIILAGRFPFHRCPIGAIS